MFPNSPHIRSLLVDASALFFRHGGHLNELSQIGYPPPLFDSAFAHIDHIAGALQNDWWSDYRPSLHITEWSAIAFQYDMYARLTHRAIFRDPQVYHTIQKWHYSNGEMFWRLKSVHKWKKLYSLFWYRQKVCSGWHVIARVCMSIRHSTFWAFWGFIG